MVSEYSDYSDDKLLSEADRNILHYVKFRINYPQFLSSENLIAELLEILNTHLSKKYRDSHSMIPHLIGHLETIIQGLAQIEEELENDQEQLRNEQKRFKNEQERLKNKLNKLELMKREKIESKEACYNTLRFITDSIDILLVQEMTSDKRKFNSTTDKEINQIHLLSKSLHAITDDTTDKLIQEFRKMSEESKRVINTTNYFEKGHHKHDHNYPPDKKVEEQDLKEQVAELRELVIQLQQKHEPATEAEAITVIDAEFSEIQKTDLPRWQVLQEQGKLLQRQIFNRERHFAATKETLSEIAKHYLEESVLGKAAVTYLNTMSANPTQGE